MSVNMAPIEEFGDIEVALRLLLRVQAEYARQERDTSRATVDVARKALYAELRAQLDAAKLAARQADDSCSRMHESWAPLVAENVQLRERLNGLSPAVTQQRSEK